ncbi:uncharacterized protein LY89DRAFT_553505, partial [Mollisia scopiformis]
AIIWTADFVAVAFTAIRLYIRGSVTKKFHWDDAVHILAMVCMIIQSAIYSGGRSLEKSVESYLAKETLVAPNFTLFLRLNIASTVITFTCYWAVKLSIMLFYRMLFWVYDTFMKAWWTVLCFTFATYWVVIATALVQCDGNGLELTSIAACSSAQSSILDKKIYKISVVMNVASDLAIMALPLVMISRMHIRTTQKLGVALIFCLSFIVVAFEIVRFFKSFGSSGIALHIIWTSVEASIAVIISCLPTFNILFRNR